MELTVEYNFSAAHRLTEAAGRCRHMHGHNYKLFVTLDGLVREADGMVMDFHEVDEIVAPVVDELDGRDLTDLMPYPTAERIAEWLFDRLDGVLAGVQTLTLYETPRYSVTVRKER